jgi:acetyltransferase-like isoleucine patch superfamily enzyme
MGPGAELRIGDGVVTERRRGALRFLLGAGARVEIGDGTWLRTDLGPVVVAAFAGARLVMGERSFLNAAHVSAKQAVTLGTCAWVGPGSRVFDSDQHDLDDARPERALPVRIGDHVWVASDVTVLKGVTIGSHTIVGARSVVTHDLPDHALAYGAPARVKGSVGDRSRAR